jgi:pimeloyl-ACP methyl ester carboxylesterase
VRYATAEDGVRIAFWTLGEGKPLVSMPTMPVSHIQLEWLIPEWRHYYTRIAEKRLLLRYDARGTGLSERHVSGYCLDSLVLDLKAVADHLGLERFDLCAPWHLGCGAVAFAARYPERVSRLVLWSCYARGLDFHALAQSRGIMAVLDSDWELYCQTVAHGMVGWSGENLGPRLVTLMMESNTQETTRALAAAIPRFDVTGLLAQVRASTLVLHRRQVPWLEVELVERLASGIPGARLVLLEGSSALPFTEDSETVVTLIDEFLSESRTLSVR